MEFIRYDPSQHDILLTKRDMPDFPAALTHKDFVNWYYGGSDHCHLYLFMDKGELAGTIGVDFMDFMYENRPMRVAAANNNVAFLPGIGGLQFLYWLKSAPYTLVFGGSQDTHDIMRQNKWRYFPPVPLWYANKRFLMDQAPFSPRTWAKRVLSAVLPTIKLARHKQKLATQDGATLSVREEHTFQEEMRPATSPFRFRFAPSLDYMRWRYATHLTFIRYRLFRILHGEKTIGHVVLKDTPEQVMVSQCDGVDASHLACGILLALAEITEQDQTPRELFLCSTHPTMQRLFQRFGFRNWRQTRPFVMGALRTPLDMANDMQAWLVNFDWNDNGLRHPFLSE